MLVAQLVEHLTKDGRVNSSRHSNRRVTVSLSKTLYLLLSTGSTQEARKYPKMIDKLLTGTLSIQTNKQTNTNSFFLYIKKT